MDLCGALSTISANQGNPCNLGYTTGIIFSQVKNTAVAKAAMALMSTFTGAVTSLQMIDTENGGVFVVKFAKATPGTTETTKWTKDDGSKVPTNIVRNEGTFDVEGGICAMRSLLAFFENQKTGYAWFIKSTGAVIGQEITAGTSEQIKVAIDAVYVEATPTDPDLIRLTLNYLEKWEKRAIAILPESGFEFLDLVDSNVSDLTFTEVSKSATSLVIDVTSPCGAPVTNLDITANSGDGWFLVFNNDTQLAVSLTSLSKSGHRYSLGFSTQTGDSITSYYDLPSASNEPYKLLKANGLTVTLP